MSMKITKKKLMETVNQEIKNVLVENYLRTEIQQFLTEFDSEEEATTEKIEDLLRDVITTLKDIDLSVDYLSAAITGHDAASIGIAQKVVGRGVSARKPPQELAELNPFKTLSQHEPEDFEEPEEDPDALKGTDVLGGEWAGPIDDEPAPRRPPQEYRQKAIELLASFNVKVDEQAIEAVAWQLYNNDMEAPTRTMEEPPKKKKRFKFFEAASRAHNPELLKLLRTMLKTAKEPYADERRLLSLGDELQDMLDQLTPAAQWAQEKGYDEPTYSENMNRYIQEELQNYLDEVYSKKQRDFMCAMKDAPDGERPESLSQGEAEHLCKAPMEEPKKRKEK